MDFELDAPARQAQEEARALAAAVEPMAVEADAMSTLHDGVHKAFRRAGWPRSRCRQPTAGATRRSTRVAVCVVARGCSWRCPRTSTRCSPCRASAAMRWRAAGHRRAARALAAARRVRRGPRGTGRHGARGRLRPQGPVDHDHRRGRRRWSSTAPSRSSPTPARPATTRSWGGRRTATRWCSCPRTQTA